MRFLAAVEDRPQAVCGTGAAGRERGTGGENRWQSSRPVAYKPEPGSGHRPVECSSHLVGTSVIGRGSVASPIEPPYTDPYVRWCGRGGGAILPPIPINPAPHSGKRKLYWFSVKWRKGVLWLCICAHGRFGFSSLHDVGFFTLGR